MINYSSYHHKQQGFTLIEIAIVLVIVGLLLGSLLGPLTRGQQQKNIQLTTNIIEDVKESVFGYFAINGYLPCPATNASNGLESRVAGVGSACTQEHGFVPVVSLGLSNAVNDNQQLIDRWTLPIRFSVNDAGTWANVTNYSLAGTQGEFEVCNQANCPANSQVAQGVVLMVYSTGPDRNANASSLDQQENLDGDDQFVSKIISEQSGNEFDDISIWVSSNELANIFIKSQ